MTDMTKKWLFRIAVIVAIAFVAFIGWRLLKPKGLPEGIVSGNGRIEAVEVDVSAKSPGRIADILVGEGDFVKAGQVVAHMDVAPLRAERAQAVAQLAQAANGIDIASNTIAQRESDRAAAAAVVQQRLAELNAAQKRLQRSETLAREGATPVQERDDDEAQVESAGATVGAARAQLAAASTAVKTARSQVIGARANVDAVRATIQRLDADLADNSLRAPVAGRVQYRVVQPGEVVAGGGKVLNLVNLSDVSMTFFLPETVAGRVGLGSDVRIVLDAASNFVIPAKVSFVADVAQFTPKTVETESERQKLMFRVKARIDPALLQRHIRQVKTGLPGLAYIRIDANAPWPDNLKVKVTQ